VGELGWQNFAATATDSQLGPAGLNNPDGSRNGLGLFLQNLDLSFTAIFTAELLVNMFAHWFFPVSPVPDHRTARFPLTPSLLPSLARASLSCGRLLSWGHAGGGSSSRTGGAYSTSSS
jgi:hypothetical protein